MLNHVCIIAHVAISGKEIFCRFFFCSIKNKMNATKTNYYTAIAIASVGIEHVSHCNSTSRDKSFVSNKQYQCPLYQ